MAGMASQRLKIRDDQFDLPFLRQLQQLRRTLGHPRSAHEVLGYRALITHPVVHIRETKPVDLSDVKALAQVTQPAVEGNHVYRMAFRLKMGDDFLRPGRVS